MNQLDSDELRREIQAHYEDVEALRDMSPFEHTLWRHAMDARYSGKIITTNEKGFADPYLLRVYLAPERADVVTMLEEVGAPSWFAKQALRLPRPFLHYFFRGDDDRAFHNHPFRTSLSFILTKGYLEHRWNFFRGFAETRMVRPGQFNLIRRDDYHKVELLGAGAWTLFFAGERVHPSDGTDWNFYDPEVETYVPWGEWDEYRAEHPHVQRPVLRTG